MYCVELSECDSDWYNCSCMRLIEDNNVKISMKTIEDRPTSMRIGNRHNHTVPRSRLNTVVYSFYPRAMRI